MDGQQHSSLLVLVETLAHSLQQDDEMALSRNADVDPKTHLMQNSLYSQEEENTLAIDAPGSLLLTNQKNLKKKETVRDLR